MKNLNLRPSLASCSALGLLLLPAAAVPLLPSPARAADHGDAPTASQDQGADIADVYFFLDPADNTKVVLCMTVHGFIVPGEATAASNLAFDADLRRRDPAWGLRSLAEVQAQAAQAGLALTQRLQMPANNLLLVFTKH